MPFPLTFLAEKNFPARPTRTEPVSLTLISDLYRYILIFNIIFTLCNQKASIPKYRNDSVNL